MRRTLTVAIFCTFFATQSVVQAGVTPLTPRKPPGPELNRYGQKKNKSSSTLWNNCGKQDHACGECETQLQEDFNDILLDLVEIDEEKRNQMKESPWSELDIPDDLPIKAGATLEETIASISDVFRKNNTQAPGELNYIVIGESESVQQTRPGYPRIALKSPESELWVTFNTDPELPGYNSLEIMRWDGRQGKFLFQEISFPDPNDKQASGHSGHIDLSGKKCIQCHKEDPRPNWDTYRSWPGVLPPRDDMLETVELTRKGDVDALKGYMAEFRSTDSNQNPDPSALAYFNFLDRVADAKESPIKNRLAVLDIPFDPEQVAEQYQDPQNDRERISAMKNTIQEKGYYRIPHYPQAQDSQSIDKKTSPLAGPSHLAFDQMGPQNICKVVTSISQHPQFDQFKYFLAGMVKCRNVRGDFNRMGQFLPSWVSNQSNQFYRDNPQSLRELSGHTKIPDTGKPSDVYDAVYQNTESSHIKANIYKQDRELRFVSSYLTEIEGARPQTANKLAEHISREKETRRVSPYHMIADPGGVNGVAENATGALASLRYGLEPFGVDVGSWSMSIGRNIADDSFSFSDQFFPLIEEERVILDVFEEAGGSCNTLAKMSREAFSNPYWKGKAPLAIDPEFIPIETLCLNYEAEETNGVIQQALRNARSIATRQLQDTAFKALQTCASCHSQDRSSFPFQGLNADGTIDEARFKNFLQDDSLLDDSYSTFGSFDNASMIINAIGVHHLSENKDEQSFAYGSMPPTGFRDLNDEARDRGMDPDQLDRLKREALALYVSEVRGPTRHDTHTRNVCRNSVYMQGRRMNKDIEDATSPQLGEQHDQVR